MAEKSDLYAMVSYLSSAVERLCEKVQSIDSTIDVSAVRADLESALEIAREIDKKEVMRESA
jgi:hypothetical protein